MTKKDSPVLDPRKSPTGECEPKPEPDHDCLASLRNMVGPSPLPTHDCLLTLKNKLHSLQVRVSTLEGELKSRNGKWAKREKTVLSRMAALQSESQIQALQYQQRINNLLAQLQFQQIPKFKGANTSEDDSKTLDIVLQRDENGSLGFNISGGKRDDMLSCAIFVTKVAAERQANNQQSALAVNDEILEVNGVSVEGSTHEEAVEVIKGSVDPVVVKVNRRRVAGHDSLPSGGGGGLHVDAASQTEFDLTTGPHGISDLYCMGSMTDLESVGAGYDMSDFLYNNYDIEYEEVVFERKSPEDKLGITICKGTEDAFNYVFVSKVESGSLADADGRISVGDQIIQINGVEVTEHQDASSLFAAAGKTSILVSRPLLAPKPNLMDLCDIGDELLGSLEEEEDSTEPHYENTSKEDDAVTDSVSSAPDKDSGLDCDSSTKNDSLSETGEHDRSRSSHDQGFYTAESLFSSDTTDYPLVPAVTRPSGVTSATLARASSVPPMRSSPQIHQLPITEENIYESIYENLSTLTKSNVSKLAKGNEGSHSSRKFSYRSKKSSSSDSFHSVSNSEERKRAKSGDRILHSKRDKSSKPHKQPKLVNPDSPSKSRSTERSREPREPRDKREKSAPRIYRSDNPELPCSRTFEEFKTKFNERSLVKRNDSILSIPAHAKQYRSYLQLVKMNEQSQDKCEGEWKVKVRPDGSRYITKITDSAEKKARGKVLRDRTEKMNQERCPVVTTDDECFSEMKTGKYWSKEERRRQYLVAQEKKFRKQVMESSRRSNQEDESVLMSLARRKQMRLGRDKILDSFITIQEIMTHGGLTSNPLLSVTTV